MNNEIMINDIVTINPDYVKYSYPFYTEWFKTYDINSEGFSTARTLNEHISVTDESYRVEWIAPHLSIDRILYAIRGVKSNYLFLIEEKVIGTHMHTIQSRVFDPAIIYKKLSKRISALKEDNLKFIRDNLELMEGNIKLMEGNNKLKENSKVSNPMPPLENGWFGFIRKYDEYGNIEEEDKDDWFVVIKTEDKCSMIYKGGGEDKFVDGDWAPFCFESAGVALDEDNQVMAMIVYLCKATSFDAAQYMYENNLKTCFIDDKEIWRR